MIRTVIQSGTDRRYLAKVSSRGSLEVLQRSDPDEKNLYAFFSNSTGSAMNINAAIAGGALNVWDGTGAGDTGTLDFTFLVTGAGATGVEDALSMRTGTNGLNLVLPDKGRLTFTGSTDMSASAVLEFYVNPQAGWVIGPILEIELRLLGTRYGNKLDITTYMADELVGTWKLVSIPLVDFGAPLGVVDEIRIKSKGLQKDFFLDDMSHGALAGGAAVDPIYEVKPSPLEEYRIQRLVLTITDTSASATIRQSWDPTGFGALASLAAGVIFTITRRQGAEVISFIFQNMAGLMAFTRVTNELIGAATTTVNFNIATEAILLNGGDNDSMRVTIRDNLSGLLGFTGTAQGTKLALKN